MKKSIWQCTVSLNKITLDYDVLVKTSIIASKLVSFHWINQKSQDFTHIYMVVYYTFPETLRSSNFSLFQSISDLKRPWDIVNSKLVFTKGCTAGCCGQSQDDSGRIRLMLAYCFLEFSAIRFLSF